MGMVEMVRPTLSRLAQLTDEAAGFSVAEGYKVHYLAQADSEHSVQVRDWTGELIPMHLVPSGMAMLAQLPDGDVQAYAARQLEATTDLSITDAELLLSRVKEVRAAGYAWGRGEFAEGINSVGAAVVDGTGSVLGAVHVHGPAYRFPADGDADRVAELVVDAASRLATSVARLGN